jgi:hypothetical protein
MTKPLSPAAQAVLDATYQEMDYAPRRHVQWAAIAALRAAVHEIRYEDEIGLTAFGGHIQAQNQILAIVAELRAS